MKPNEIAITNAIIEYCMIGNYKYYIRFDNNDTHKTELYLYSTIREASDKQLELINKFNKYISIQNFDENQSLFPLSSINAEIKIDYELEKTDGDLSDIQW